MNDSERQELGWSIVELMGHRRLAGKLEEVAIAGHPMLRLDVPTPDGGWVTQYYGGQAVYCITPTTEAIAHAVAAGARPEPVHRWELPATTQPSKPAEGERLAWSSEESRFVPYPDDQPSAGEEDENAPV